jgi:uncharacterized peroxidase-related enzyme
MTRLPMRTIDDAPENTRASLVASEKSNGYLPNLLRILANAPVALETYLTVSSINARSSLSVVAREAVQITAAAVHGCAYCVAGHSLLAEKKAKLDGLVIDELRDRIRVSDPKLDAVARFAEAVIASRGNVTDDELARFRDAGFTDQAALEIVLGVGLATLCNFANNLAHGPLNEELREYVWTLPSSRVSVAESAVRKV